MKTAAISLTFRSGTNLRWINAAATKSNPGFCQMNWKNIETLFKNVHQTNQRKMIPGSSHSMSSIHIYSQKNIQKLNHLTYRRQKLDRVTHRSNWGHLKWPRTMSTSLPVPILTRRFGGCWGGYRLSQSTLFIQIVCEMRAISLLKCLEMMISKTLLWANCSRISNCMQIHIPYHQLMR